MSGALSYRQHGVDGDWDVVVIGSGIGGLAAASMLARHGGKRVLILEQHYTVGGFTHAFKRPDYEWDVGIHYIGQTQPGRPVRRLFDELTDGALEWADMGEVYDRIVIAGDAYDFPRGREAFRDRMVDYFPAESAAIDAYLGAVDRAAKRMGLFFAEKAVPAPVQTLLGWLMRWPAMRVARRTTLEVLRELTGDALLIGVLTGQYGDYGLPPGRSSFAMHAMVARHYLWGGAYPVGGGGRVAATILPAIEAAGGGVRTRAEVAEVLVEDGRAAGVRLEDGAEVRTDAVVSDAGARVTFGRLLPEPVRHHHRLEERLAEVEPSVAHASLYIGLDGTADELGLPRHNLWIFPHHDHDRNTARYVKDPGAPLPVVFVSFPSAKDPDFERRYPGRATIEAVTLAPWERFERWKDTRWQHRGPEYEALKEQLTARLREVVDEHVPQAADRVDHAELSTPLSTRRFAGHPHGEIYGLAHSPARFDARWLRPRTPVPGLYLTGADVATAGVAGAMLGGALTASAMLGRNLIH